MLKLVRCLAIAISISLTWTSLVSAEEVLTPKKIIEQLEIRDNCPRERVKKKATKNEFDLLNYFERKYQRCDEATAVFAGNYIGLRIVVIEEGITEYFDGVRIITLPKWSLISYAVQTPNEQLSGWHNVKTLSGENERWHIYFTFTVNFVVPTDKLNEFINDYLTKPSRKYDGAISYQIFKTRNDKRTIPMEDFTRGAKVFYMEIKVDVEKIDGIQLPTP